MSFRWHATPVVVLALTLLAGCAKEAPPVVETIPRVKFFAVGEQTGGQVRRLSGRLVAADTSPLGFAVSGTVAEVLVSQGDRVAVGQTLARLDAEPLRLAVEQARAQLSVSRATAVETHQVYERTAGLFEKRAASQAELDTATANHAAARGNVRAAQSELAQRERDLTRAELTAPFAGTVATRSIDTFQEVSAGGEAFVVQADDVLEVQVRVPETLIRYVDYSQAVQIQLPSVENQTIYGVVTEIAAQSQSGNAYPVRVQLAATELPLRPGMTASVTFNFTEYLEDRAVYLIPLSALAIDHGVVNRTKAGSDAEEGTVPVFLIANDNRVTARDVVVGGLRGDQLEVFEGLAPGDRVISAGVAFLREGMEVEPWTQERGLTGG